MRRSAALATLLGGSALVLASCGAKNPPLKGAVGVPAVRRPASPAASAAAAPFEMPPPVASSVLAEVPDGTYGPYVGRRGDLALAAWATPGQGGRTWKVAVLGPDGRLAGPARDGGPAPDAPPRVVVRAVERGFALAWIEPVDRASAVKLALFGVDGAPRGPAQLVVQSPDPVPYVDVVALPTGPLVVWAVDRRGRAELWGAAVDEAGRARAAGAPFVTGALGWQVAELGGNALAAVVTAPDHASAGAVSVVAVGRDAKALGAPVVVSASRTAEPDVDLARVGDRAVLAWTDRRGLDGAVWLASVDARGRVAVAPAPATAPRGDQALLGLAAPDAADGAPRALLAWENLAERTAGPDLPAGLRAIRLGAVDGDAKLGAASATLAFAGGPDAAPELAVAPGGYVVTTLAAACPVGIPCSPRAPLAPTAVRFDRDLRPVGTEPLRAQPFGGEAASLTWGLSCGAGGCFALAAGGGSPSPVAALAVAPREGAWLPVAARDPAPHPPFAGAIDAIAAGERLADVAAAQVDRRTVVGWITYFAAEPDAASSPTRKEEKREKRPLAATVAVRALDDAGAPLGEPTVLSVRGESIGGVSIAPGAPGKGEACVAWVARDEGDLQVFLTRVGSDGKKQAQRMLTRAKGDASDVAIAWAGDGWIVAWVDGRDGNGEVYAAKVDRNLERKGPERRLTDAPGDAADARVLVHDGDAWVAWVDRRGGQCAADPYVVRLAASDLAPRGAETQVAASSAHSRSPELAWLGDGAVLGWIDQEGEGASGGAMLARLDASGRPVGAPARVAAPGRASSLGLACDAGACRTIVASGEGDSLLFSALRWTGASTDGARTLARIAGLAADDVAPALAGDAVLFAADDRTGRGKVRRLRIRWE